MERILSINPGSSSTKVGFFAGEKEIFIENIAHSRQELSYYASVTDQYVFRRMLVLSVMKKHGIALSDLDAVAARGGLMAPINHGAYKINRLMADRLRYNPVQQHASNLAALIAWSFTLKTGVPSYIYDGISVNELDEINRISGVPGIERESLAHVLNTRAAAIKYAKSVGKDIKELSLITAHLGSGVTVNLHKNGRLSDNYNDSCGAFSTERSGGLPLFDVIKMCFAPQATEEQVFRLLKYQSGLIAYLGTNDCRKVEEMIKGGDERARLIYDAMGLNVAKSIAAAAVSADGKVDRIILTGGMAYSEYLTGYIEKKTAFIAPATVYPGEDETRALAMGVLRVLRGEEEAQIYTDR